MGTQKKNKRLLLRIINFFVPLFFLFILSSCSIQNTKDVLVENDFRNVRAGMTEKEIQKRFGEPNRVIKNKKEIEKLRDSDLEASDRWAEEDPEIYIKFYGSEKKVDEYYKLRKENGYTACFEYDYKYDDKSSGIEKWHIYFYKDEVVWMSFP